MEGEERDRHTNQNRIRDARLSRLKTLEEFDFIKRRRFRRRKIRELS